MTMIYQVSQPYPHTTAVYQAMGFIDKLRKARSESNTSPIGLIWGAPGSGKTVAARASLRNPDPCRSLEIMFSVPSRCTPSLLAHVFATHMNNPWIPKRRKHSAVDKCVALIQQNETELIIADHAEEFTKKTLQAIQEIRDRCHVTIVLVVLRRMKDFVKVPAISDDIKEFEFPSVEVAEVLDLVLPQIGVQGWQYDPDNPEDRATGQYMWSLACPSLRCLRALVQLTVSISSGRSLKLSQALIDQAVKFTSLRDV